MSNITAAQKIASDESADIPALMHAIGRQAREAASVLALASRETKDAALHAMARAVRARANAILAANAEDVAQARKAGITGSFLDRLELNPDRVEAIARGLEDIATLPDPVGEVIAEWTRPNGLRFERVRTPLGVIGVIYESRPNVTADAGAIALKAGNAVILRGGSDSMRSSREIHAALTEGLAEAGLPETAIQLVPVKNRDAVGEMLRGLDGAVDVIVPRGGRSLVERVQNEARVPVFAHLDGNCHIYVHAPCDLEMARRIVLNAKLRRTGVCGASETLLVDRALADSHLRPLVQALIEGGCEVRGDDHVRAADARARDLAPEDWATEYLDSVIAVGVVDGLDDAIAHIARYGSHHTDAILTDDEVAAAEFLRRVDSAIVVHNASTQFADGGEFGFGAEIGIATGRMHARGPVGVEQLTSFKYRVHGHGQTRP